MMDDIVFYRKTMATSDQIKAAIREPDNIGKMTQTVAASQWDMFLPYLYAKLSSLRSVEMSPHELRLPRGCPIWDSHILAVKKSL